MAKLSREKEAQYSVTKVCSRSQYTVAVSHIHKARGVAEPNTFTWSPHCNRSSFMLCKATLSPSLLRDKEYLLLWQSGKICWKPVQINSGKLLTLELSSPFYENKYISLKRGNYLKNRPRLSTASTHMQAQYTHNNVPRDSVMLKVKCYWCRLSPNDINLRL